MKIETHMHLIYIISEEETIVNIILYVNFSPTLPQFSPTKKHFNQTFIIVSCRTSSGLYIKSKTLPI